MDQNRLMKLLVDKYGLSYQQAENICKQDNVYDIFTFIKIAYEKGKKDGTPDYTYSGGY